MIRILHSVSYMSRGGIETMLMNYYRRIDRTIVQFDFLCNSPLKGEYDDEILSLGGRIYRSPGFSPLRHRAYKRFMKTLFEEHPEYRIVEAHNGPLGRYAMKAAKDNGIPVRIYHAHGADLPFNLKWPIKYYCMKTLKYSMNEHFVCSEKAGRFYMGNKIMNNGDYYFIPNAIAVDDFVFNMDIRSALRERYNIVNKKVIGHIGRISLPKNHPFILNVFAKLHTLDSDTHLVLVGGGERESKIKAQIKELGIEDAVTMTGVIPNPQDWYQAFDVFFMPSLWEGLPVTGVEAQAADLPCLFSDAITQEVKLSEKAQFMSLKEPLENWSCKLSEILNNLSEREDNTHLITKCHYNIEKEAVRLQELYLSLAQKTIL